MAGNVFFLLARAQVPLWMAKAVIWGWGIELISLVCVVGRVAARDGLRNIFKTGREV